MVVERVLVPVHLAVFQVGTAPVALAELAANCQFAVAELYMVHKPAVALLQGSRDSQLELFVHKAIEPAPVHSHKLIVGGHKVRAVVCLCKNFRHRLVHSKYLQELKGRYWIAVVAGDYNHQHCADYKCLTSALPAFDHSISQRLIIWHGDQVECLARLV
jgi:hypothetical protein